MPTIRPSGPPGDGRRASPGTKRLDREQRQIEDQLRLTNDVVELSANALDALTAMLIIEVILLPLFFIAGTGVYPMVLYAMAITAVCFVLFFSVNVLGERFARGQKARLDKLGPEMPAVKVIKPGRPR